MVCLLPLFAKDIVLGGKDGWPELQVKENITKGKGRFGYDCLQLETNSFVSDRDTDLLIDFEDARQIISDGQYTVLQNNIGITNQTNNEKFAGLSRNLGGLRVQGKPGTFFGSEGLLGSFTIEYWLCPSLVENGEVIFNWESSKNVDGRLVYQLLSGVFNKGHMEWSFSNFFDGYKNEDGKNEIYLKGSKRLIPDEWSYHVISFDSESGLLEYILDGSTEDLKYITADGNEGGEVSLVYLGTPSEVSFCSEYTGAIDDIRIMRRPYMRPEFQSAEYGGKIGHTQYLPQGGRFVSRPIMVSNGSILTELEAEVNCPAQTDVSFFVRSGDNFFNWTDSYPEWKAVKSGEEISGVNGLYFQVSAELLPDGSGDLSPSVTEIVLKFEELPEPLPPFVVKAVAGNGSVTVSWNYSVDETAGGYYLYYGNRPGEYLGRIALEGESPIDVGNTTSFTVTGLENGKIYYFALAAWSAHDKRVVGELSKEVFARPLAYR
ncbi:MAG: fibronectin type III domain-containing protein [Treponema sp.]|nr:fibronectin type III domain-containing protein [Treponema sp.]